MPATRSKFRALQDESFDIKEIDDADLATASGNSKFIAVIALSVVVAVSLATVLSISW
jgi:hypothetical protein